MTPLRARLLSKPTRRAVLACLGGGLSGPAWADAGPVLCGQAPWPAYPGPDQPPAVQTWLGGAAPLGTGPDCSGLGLSQPELLVRLTGSCHRHVDLAEELRRFGRVSRLEGLAYWSFTDRKREVLIPHAHAVTDAAASQARAEFSLDELRSGQPLYFVHDDNRSHKQVIYSMRLQQSMDDRFSLHFENTSAMSMMGLTLLAPHELQWLVSVQRLGAGLWGYRSLLGLRRLRMGRAGQHRLSNLSRALAMFDLWAGRQTDAERYR